MGRADRLAQRGVALNVFRPIVRGQFRNGYVEHLQQWPTVLIKAKVFHNFETSPSIFMAVPSCRS